MKTKAFTLVEILVWISISMILMISVWLLVSGGIKNITSQEKVLDNISDFTITETKLNNIFSNINNNFKPIKTNSWIILKINNSFNEWWFVYIWSTWSSILNWDWIYCLSWSEDINTNHIFIKNFIPFEENSEDIFNDFNSTMESKEIIINYKKYKSIQKEHKIVIQNWTNWETIIWKEIFWDKFKNWNSWKDIYLNSPTWLAKIWNNLIISDTLNNRVIYYDTTNDKVYKLLDENDWLIEPTGLYYDTPNKILYISNSWRWEIVKLSSKNITSPELILNWINKSNISEFNIEFFNENWPHNIINIWNIDIDIENHTQVIWDNYSKSWNKLTFTFSWWTTHNFTNSYIKINNITNFIWSGTYYVKLDINNKIYPYFIQWDNKVVTIWDNTLINNWWLKYPTGIWWNWANDFKETWYFTWSTTNNIIFNKKYDYILETPIKNLDINYDSGKKLLNLELKYFKKYNCFNLDEKIERTFILKKNFK